MEQLGLSGFDGIRTAVRKKRSRTYRRPKADSQPFADSRDHSSASTTTTPLSDDLSKFSSHENADINSKRKELNLNQFVSTIDYASSAESQKVHIRNKESGGLSAFLSNDFGWNKANNRRSRGALAPANWKSTSKAKECLDSESRSVNSYNGRNGERRSSEQSVVTLDALVNKHKVKKVRLNVGDVTRTIHASSSANDESSIKNSRSFGTSKSCQKQSLQHNAEEKHSIPDKRTGLQGVPWKNFSGGSFCFVTEESLVRKISGKSTSGKQGDKLKPIPKSKLAFRIPISDAEFDEDDEMRYLKKLKSKHAGRYKEGGEESTGKQRKLSTVVDASRLVRDGKKSISDQALENTDFEDEEEPLSYGVYEGKKRKKQKKESIDSLMDGKREITLTTRQRALQSSKDGSSVPGANLIEFPNGLPLPPSKKQKEQLTVMEQQLKREEAAQRRRMQVEKAARESEAEAIRKILGQNSSRKKREDKIKKRLEELAQEKAANALSLASNTVRWVVGPTGTIVTFSQEIGLPSIFESKPPSYPPPREECAGPSCTNPFKYRDSKSKLPLCSLQCYKAVQKQRQIETSS